MRHLAPCNILFSVVLVLFITSCHKEATKDPYTGDSATLLNGNPLNFKVAATLFHDQFGFDLIYLEDKRTRLVLDIFEVPDLIGNYRIYPSYSTTDTFPTAILYSADEDFAKDDYLLIDTIKNNISIEYLDNKTVAGTYALYFIRPSFVPKTDVFPDTICFSQGKFTTGYVVK